MNDPESGDPGLEPKRAYPTSLCHRCQAPPRYVRTDKGSTFIHCPILKRYPPQPVQACAAFVPRSE